MNTEGNMEAICINVDNSGLKGIKVFGLTKGKKYQVKQSKEYDNYFDLENDFGIIESYRKERFEVMEEKKVQERFNVKCIDNCYNGNKLSLTVQKEYEVVAENSKSYSLKNDNGMIQPYDKKHFKKVKVNKDHTPNYAEEQLENAIQKRITCYQKECSGNRENKCTVKDRICVSRLEKPINYEEEYKKLKEENEKIIKEKELLESQLENELGRNGILKEKLDKANSESAEYFIRWGDAESKNKKLEEKISCAEQDINRLNTENACLKAFNEKSENRIQHLINSIKNMSEVL